MIIAYLKVARLVLSEALCCFCRDMCKLLWWMLDVSLSYNISNSIFWKFISLTIAVERGTARSRLVQIVSCTSVQAAKYAIYMIGRNPLVGRRSLM